MWWRSKSRLDEDSLITSAPSPGLVVPIFSNGILLLPSRDISLGLPEDTSLHNVEPFRRLRIRYIPLIKQRELPPQEPQQMSIEKE